ncbi:gamma-glutamylcyclotransferase [bacterium]|nr:gamma-glutamylcyclotransferase [bacterium]
MRLCLRRGWEVGRGGMGEPVGVFVYGTLKGGERNAALVIPVSRRPAALKAGRLYHLPPPAGYPALYLDGPGPIRGELLRFTDGATLEALDRLEGYAGLFLRSVVKVVCDGACVCVWVYHFPPDRPVPPGAEEVNGGDWRSSDYV